jgi:hexosaminidase
MTRPMARVFVVAVLAFTGLFAAAAHAEAPRLIPAPATLETNHGKPFAVTPDTRIVARDDARDVAEQLAGVLRRSTGFPLPVVRRGGHGRAIALELDHAPRLGREGYRLDVSHGGARLRATTTEGLFRGVQTVRQLLPARVEADTVQPGPWTLPAVRIEDRPRYAFRGSLLDPARHFLTVDEIKRYIDLIAMYKVNVLHLHLTDDQGWRIQIDSWPRLAEIGGSSELGGGPGGYYTKADYAEIVRYAAERYITIVPEIEFPGHTGAILKSYPDLCPSTGCRPTEEVFGFLDDVIREVAEMTPGPYVHIGGDEAYSTTPEDYLAFLERAEDIVYSHGKTMIGWGEIANTPLRTETIAQYWGTGLAYPPGASDLARRAVQMGVKLLMSPADRIYLDMKYTADTPLGLDWAGLVEVQDAYSWEPATHIEGVGEGDILGVEAPLWGETVEDIDDAEFLAFPRLPGAAEIGWSPAQGRWWEEYRLRLAAQGPRWHALSVNFYRSPQVPWEP